MTFLWCMFLALCVGLELGLADPSPVESSYCTTNDDKPGRCVPYFDCPYIVALVTKRKSGYELTDTESNTLKYARSPCSRFTKTVCCADFVNPAGLELLKKEQVNCGKFTELKVAASHEIKMGSRPWMALLQFNDSKSYRSSFKCGATVITSRYLLTAAHCIKKSLFSVRLGEHNIMSKKDCKAYGNTVLCGPDPVDIPVHSFVIHKEFNDTEKHDDVALIRLSTEIKNYQPICLPLDVEIQQNIRRSKKQFVTGWGLNGKTKSNVPNEAEVNLLRKCPRSRYDNQVCVDGRVKDSCSGDSGGPLAYPYFYKNSQRFVQSGIVSYGNYNCGKGLASIYTDVTRFVPWITQNIMHNVRTH